MEPCVIVMSTAGSSDQASEIARALVERRLAACAQVLPGVCSTFRWEGEVRTESETVLWIKTRAALSDVVRDTIRALHTYDVPEIVVVPIAGGDPAYLGWIVRETSQVPQSPRSA